MATAACVFALLSINPLQLPQLPRVCHNEMCNVKMVDLRKCKIRCRPPLGPEWSLMPSTGYAYLYVKQRVTWEEAEKECRRRGATLASVHNAAENDFIYSNTKNFAQAGLSPYNTLWLGRIKTNPNGGYRWHDGTPFDYNKWAEHHPNNLESGDNCIAFYNRRMNCNNEEKYIKRWIDLCCTKKVREGFVCKKFHGKYSIVPARRQRSRKSYRKSYRRSRRSYRRSRRSRRFRRSRRLRRSTKNKKN